MSRYAFAELRGSRALGVFLCVALVPFLSEVAAIYLSHNAAARSLLGILKLEALLRIDAGFYRQVLSVHCFFGFILAAWLGPTLVAPDLVHGALPLFLSRPLSRTDYVVGKAVTLLLSTSLLTWIPGVALYFLDAILRADGWWLAHFYIPIAYVIGGTAWSVVVTLGALAASAWLRWRLAASALVFGVHFVSAGIGDALMRALGTPWARLGHFAHLFDVIWSRLFRLPRTDREIPVLAACTVLGVLCSVCLLVLGRRLRASEVVR
jgi:ABC-2 type transport system permease protein